MLNGHRGVSRYFGALARPPATFASTFPGSRHQFHLNFQQIAAAPRAGVFQSQEMQIHLKPVQYKGPSDSGRDQGRSSETSGWLRNTCKNMVFSDSRGTFSRRFEIHKIYPRKFSAFKTTWAFFARPLGSHKIYPCSHSSDRGQQGVVQLSSRSANISIGANS